MFTLVCVCVLVQVCMRVSESETIVVYTCTSLVGWRLRASRLRKDEHLKTAQYMKEGASKDSTMMEGASKDGTIMEGASKDGTMMEENNAGHNRSVLIHV